MDEFVRYKIERTHLKIDALHYDKDNFDVFGWRKSDGKRIFLGAFETQEEAENWLEAEKRGDHKPIRAFLSNNGQLFIERDGEFASITT